MAQETLKRILWVVLSLPRQDQEWISEQLLLNIKQETLPTEDTELIDLCVEDSVQQIAQGRIMTQAEAKSKRKQLAEELFHSNAL